LFVFYFKFLNYIKRCIKTWKTWKWNCHLGWANQERASPSLGGTTRNDTPWFSWTHWTLKNHRKHLNEHFHKTFFWIHLLGSIDFEISIISRMLCILMFLIITFIKSFKNITLILIIDFFGQEHKSGTWFKKFFMNFFLR